MPYSSSLGNILIVDDDINVVGLLQVNLRSEGYSVESVSSASEVDIDMLDGINLVIVDAMGQEYNGMDLIRSIKGSDNGIGVIFYSQFDSDRNIIEALDAGADDCILKPFSLRELVARVRSVMRRYSRRTMSGSKKLLTFKNLSADTSTNVVTLEGQPLPLSKTSSAPTLWASSRLSEQRTSDKLFSAIRPEAFPRFRPLRQLIYTTKKMAVFIRSTFCAIVLFAAAMTAAAENVVSICAQINASGNIRIDQPEALLRLLLAMRITTVPC